jgi:hypothetical protein
MTTKLSSSLHITIGVHPSTNIDFESEIRLVKSALLYADKITLCSFTASMLEAIKRFPELPVNEQMMCLQRVIPYISEDKKAAQKSIERIKTAFSPRQMGQPHIKAERAILIEMAEAAWIAMKDKADELANKGGWRELAPAIDAGIVNIHKFSDEQTDRGTAQFVADCMISASGRPLSERDKNEVDARTSKQTTEFTNFVCDAVLSGDTYPIFDVRTGQLVDAAQREGKLRVTTVSEGKSRHIALANDFLQRLPVLDTTKIEHVIAIRENLEKYLHRFRSSVVTYSEAISSNPWNPDFEIEAEKLFIQQVVPAVMDIDVEIKSNRFIESLARNSVDKPLVLASGSVLGLMLSQIPNLPSAISTSLGLTASASLLVYDTYKDWKSKQQNIERNGLYFYYRASKQLSSLDH